MNQRAEISTSPGVHLVGSIPVDTAGQAFRLAMQYLRGHVKRLPDGEVGERDTWIRWQYARIGASPQLEKLDRENTYVPVPPFGIVDGTSSADEIEFPDLGYAEAALESWATFERLVNEGVIPEDVRFQVGLPTPLSVALFYLDPASRHLFETAYERALETEISKMLDHIPAQRLAIQWETVSEFALLEGLMDNHLNGDSVANVTRRVAALIALVPEPVEVGLHLCYGDSGHKHFCEPADAGFLATVAAGILGRVTRPVGWIHLPVPKERDDEEYFVPLGHLELPEQTDLYLGLVHATGGAEGTRRRVAAAKRVIDRFGIATECGLGRRDPDSIEDLLRQHAQIVSAP